MGSDEVGQDGPWTAWANEEGPRKTPKGLEHRRRLDGQSPSLGRGEGLWVDEGQASQAFLGKERNGVDLHAFVTLSPA